MIAQSASSMPVLIVGIVFTFVYLIIRAGLRDSAHRRRIALVDRALASGAIDERQKRELLEVVTGARTGRGERGVHPVFLLGWIGLFVGIGLTVVGWQDTRTFQAGILTAAVSFGLLTVPLASRELQARRSPDGRRWAE